MITIDRQTFVIASPTTRIAFTPVWGDIIRAAGQTLGRVIKVDDWCRLEDGTLISLDEPVAMFKRTDDHERYWLLDAKPE